MKKKLMHAWQGNSLSRKILLTMRITLSLMILSIFSAYSATYAQKTKLNLRLQNASIKEILQEIESQSEFSFMYDNKQVDVERSVNIEVKEQTIDLVLEKLFKETNTNFKVVNRQILLFSDDTNNGVLQQSKTVSGKITDSSGASLPGVSIVVKGTTNGTITDGNGMYTIANIPENAILQFSFVGMKAQEVSVSGKSTINLVLEDETIGIEEVVAVGYGTQKKVNMTGAVDVISNKELSNRQASTVSQLLQGLSPGATLSIGGTDGFQPGAAMNITIRGMGSLNGGKPYILIDGFPGDLNSLNPEDIESISILKDAASSAIYGARAPYGVILVTTKKGRKNEKITATYSGNIFINTPPPLPKSLDSYTWSRVQNEAGDNLGGHPISNATMDQIIAYQNKDWEYLKQFMPAGATHFGAFPSGKTWNNGNLNYGDTDWWDVYYGNSINQKHDFSIHGGTEKASYYFSAGYLKQEGVLNYGTDEFSRMNVIGKVDLDITDWWKFSWETRLTKKDREKPNNVNVNTYANNFRAISRSYPITPIYDGFGYYLFESHIPEIISGSDTYNELDYWNNFKMELNPAKGWKINADFAYNSYSGVGLNTVPPVYENLVDQTRVAVGNTVPGKLERTTDNNNYWSTNLYTSYNLDVNEAHNFNLMVGTQFEKGNNVQMYGYKTDMIVESIPSFQTSTGTAILREALPQRATQGYFSRFSYNYKEKYLFESNLRYDGSYVFREGNRWGLFPSFSAGWNVHKEAFWGNLDKYINAFKLRASWGQLGNQEVAPYSDLSLIPLQTGQLNWIFNYGTVRPIGYTSAPNIVNKNLTWETASTKNLGANLSLFDNKLGADIDVYERITSDMVGPSQAKPGVLGANVPKTNNSTLRTRGWELSLNWKQSLNNGISYYLGLNLADYKSVVTKYYNPTGTLTTWYEGAEVGEIWGYTVYDLYRNQEEMTKYLAEVNLKALGTTWRTGDLKYEDTNGDKIVNNGTNSVKDHGDLSIIGNESPRYQYGLSAGLNFKGFDFSMLWNGVLKKEMYFTRMANIYWGFTNGWWESTVQPRNLDYFRDAPGTKYSGVYEGDANINLDGFWPRPYLDNTQEAKNKNNPNTRYLADASYLRMQNIQLGYSLPKSIISKLKIQKLRLSFSGENLITFTKLPDGIDPVVPNGQLFQGTSNGRLTYGADRVYSFGISVTY
jgi:TonB-linked SusC/RagA family outer membrane protein